MAQPETRKHRRIMKRSEETAMKSRLKTILILLIASIALAGVHASKIVHTRTEKRISCD